ncbi:alpha/beta hydrolase [Companilactobacillus nodensis]|uniref:alpha/beta hydrolase n=1 Tax=Companilactobacillus nodensis TaxID=460870 RepID=UPI001F2643F3|nr:alpha/beta hydrolase [Companilactobacillus nodensis]
MYWAQQGFAFVNFNYRLAPKTAFPGALVDTDTVIQWVAAHGADYNLDLDKVILIGDSAGGTLAFQYITAYTQSEYRNLFGFKKPNLNIVGVLMNCGVYLLDHSGNMSGGMTAYFTKEVQRDMQAELSPENYVDKTVPPLAIVTANRDFAHDQ